MQKSEEKSVCLTGSETALKWFLRSVYFLRKYPHEEDIEKDMKLGSLSWAQNQIWNMITKIQFLKYRKIVWPDNLRGSNIWVISVDGMHVWICEPGHPKIFSR